MSGLFFHFNCSFIANILDIWRNCENILTIDGERDISTNYSVLDYFNEAGGKRGKMERAEGY